MKPAERVAAGIGLAGLAWLAHTALNASDGFQQWHAGSLVAGLGLLVAALGAAGLRAGHGHGLPALALGLVVTLVGALAGLGFTLGWSGRTALWVGADLLQSVGAAQAAWFGVLWAARPAHGARRVFGIRAGLALLAAGLLVDGLGNATTGFPLEALLDGVTGAGLAAAAAVRGPWAPAPVPGGQD